MKSLRVLPEEIEEAMYHLIRVLLMSNSLPESLSNDRRPKATADAMCNSIDQSRLIWPANYFRIRTGPLRAIVCMAVWNCHPPVAQSLVGAKPLRSDVLQG